MTLVQCFLANELDELTSLRAASSSVTLQIPGAVVLPFVRKERGELHTLLLLSLRVRAMACFLWNRLPRCPVLSIYGIHGPRHSERHCRYNMMGTGFLLEVQEASLHHIALFTRGAVESLGPPSHPIDLNVFLQF